MKKHICSEVKAEMCRLVYLKGRCNIPSFPKSCHLAAAEVAVNMWSDMKHEVGREVKQVEFVFKIRALHCTPLEFRTGFLAGGF